MNAPFAAARAAYARPEAPSRTPRAVEYDLLARATQRLQDGWTRRQTHPAGFLAALDENERIWTALAMEVADPANALPPQLRARLFYLYEFTAHQGRDLRQGKGSAEVLVDINTAVMRGLRGQGASA